MKFSLARLWGLAIAAWIIVAIGYMSSSSFLKTLPNSASPLGEMDASILFEHFVPQNGSMYAQAICNNKAVSFKKLESEITVLEISSANCVDLLKGTQVQIVDSNVRYAMECKNCKISTNGEWSKSRNKDVRIWRGSIALTATSENTPVLQLIPYANQ